jgi:hypothetical protein
MENKKTNRFAEKSRLTCVGCVIICAWITIIACIIGIICIHYDVFSTEVCQPVDDCPMLDLAVQNIPTGPLDLQIPTVIDTTAAAVDASKLPPDILPAGQPHDRHQHAEA